MEVSDDFDNESLMVLWEIRLDWRQFGEVKVRCRQQQQTMTWNLATNNSAIGNREDGDLWSWERVLFLKIGD